MPRVPRWPHRRTGSSNPGLHAPGRRDDARSSSMSTTVRARVVVAASALVALVAVPAGAHPAVADGGEAPADSLATITLDLVHGCTASDDHGGAEHPTTEVALEVPDVMTHVDPLPTDGWDVDTETDDGRVAVVVWADDGGAEPAPSFDLDIVVEGEPGEEIYLRVVQSCGELSERWVGTPDDPADDPAVRLVLAEPDPDSPPPESDEPDTDEPAREESPGDGSGQQEAADDESDDRAASAGASAETDDVADAEEDGAEAPLDEDPVAGLEPATGPLGPAARTVIGVLLFGAAAAVLLVLRRRHSVTD